MKPLFVFALMVWSYFAGAIWAVGPRDAPAHMAILAFAWPVAAVAVFLEGPTP